MEYTDALVIFIYKVFSTLETSFGVSVNTVMSFQVEHFAILRPDGVVSGLGAEIGFWPRHCHRRQERIRAGVIPAPRNSRRVGQVSPRFPLQSSQSNRRSLNLFSLTALALVTLAQTLRSSPFTPHSTAISQGLPAPAAQSPKQTKGSNVLSIPYRFSLTLDDVCDSMTLEDLL